MCIERDNENDESEVEQINTGSDLSVQFNVQTYGCNWHGQVFVSTYPLCLLLMTKLYLHYIISSILSNSNLIESFLYNKEFLCIIPLFSCPLSLGPLSCFFAKLRKATISSVMSVCPSAWNYTDTDERIFGEVGDSVFFENMSRISKFHQNMTRITGTLHEDQNTVFIVSRSFLLRIRNV